MDFFIFFFLLLFNLPTSRSQEEYTVKCQKPFTCGFLANLSYPFWGGNRPSTCGHPDFKLNCEESKYPLMVATQQYFRVLKVNLSSVSMTIARDDYFSNDGICQINPSNTTLDATILTYNPSGFQNISIFYNCTQKIIDLVPESYRFACPGDGFFANEGFLMSDLGYSALDLVENCETRVEVPIQTKVVDGIENGEGFSVEPMLGGLRKGFNVSYGFDCSSCRSSGGSCVNVIGGGYLPTCDKKVESSPLTNLSSLLPHQMDPKTLSRSNILHTNYMILTTFTLIATLANPALSLNTKFDACAPANCGNVPNISYPFWLSSIQDPFCDYPNFEITCNDEREPVLAISEDEYRIKDIVYTNQSIFVANAPAYDHQSCPALDVHNISLYRTPFSILPGYVNLSLFYNCSTKPSSLDYMYPIDCLTNFSSVSYASLHKEFYQVHDSSFVESCQGFVDAPVITSSGVVSMNSLMSMNYTEVLDLGFVLNWTTQNCSSCELSGGRCGFENQALVCFCHDKTHPVSCHDGKHSNRRKRIIGIVSGVVGALLLIPLAWIICQLRKRRRYAPSSYASRSISSDPSSRSDVEKGSRYMGAPLFTYTELADATNNFDERKELGDGGFGTVYYGKLKDGREVAVKRLYENNYRRVEQFMNEVDILTRLQHKNLVILYGCTSRHSRELLLVYEHIENGTVADHLHGVKARPGSLPWPLRLNIAVETARALTYLHASDIIHRDVKTNNILLDKNFCVKVADFGLSRLFPMDVTHISTAPQGTPGYVDPEYHQCYQLTNKSDVYSFGVVLAELISSLPAVDITRHRHEINLFNMAINKIQRQALHEFVDLNLGFSSDETMRKSISAVAELAFQCLQSAKELRPTMNEVLETLTTLQGGKRDPDQSPDNDTTSDDVGLLKYGASPLSPVSVTAKWSSSSGATTPNTSS